MSIADRTVCRRVLGGSAILALLLAAASPAFAEGEVVHVFFAGGQSNAVPQYWGEGIRSELEKSGKFGDFEFVAQKHSGNGMWNWVGFTRDSEGEMVFKRNLGETGSGGNYAADFFNDEGTGALQKVVNQVKANGDIPKVSLFWFQGEGDTANMSGVEYWGKSFSAMLKFIQEDVGQTDPVLLGLTIIDYNREDTGLSEQQRTAVDALRVVQAEIGTANEFAVTLDSASYTRQDAWHLIREHNTQCGADLAKVYIQNLVPEPTSLGLLGATVLAALTRR